MFCPKCGSPIIDGGKFCSKCGSRIEISIPQNSRTEATVPGTTATGSTQGQVNFGNDFAAGSRGQVNYGNVGPSEKKSSSKKPLIITLAAVAGVALIGLAVFLVVSHKNRNQDIASNGREELINESASAAEEYDNSFNPWEDEEDTAINENGTSPEENMQEEAVHAVDPVSEDWNLYGSYKDSEIINSSTWYGFGYQDLSDTPIEPDLYNFPQHELLIPDPYRDMREPYMEDYTELNTKSKVKDVESKVDEIYEKVYGFESLSGSWNGWQNVAEDYDGSSFVCSVTVGNGDPELDPLMKSVGYKNYQVEYYYDAPDTSHTLDCGPMFARLAIDGDWYEYYFHKNNLIRRDTSDFTNDNPKTSDFIKGIYRVGCDYHRIDNFKGYDSLLESAESWRYSYGYNTVRAHVAVTSNDDIFFDDDKVYIRGFLNYQVNTRQNYADFYSEPAQILLCFDADTFLTDPEMLDQGQPGDNAIEWLQRLSDADYYGMGVAGVYDVLLTGRHVDEVYGLYWWD